MSLQYSLLCQIAHSADRMLLTGGETDTSNNKQAYKARDNRYKNNVNVIPNHTEHETPGIQHSTEAADVWGEFDLTKDKVTNHINT